EVADQVIADNRKVMETNETTTFQDEVVTPGGKRTLLTTKGPLHDTEGRVIGMFGIARDISEMKSIEMALRRERDRNQRYLDSAQTFMLALDGEGRVSMINRYGCELLGYRESEMIGQNWFRHYLPQPEGMEVICPMFQKMFSGKLDGTEYHENEVLCRDGSRRLIAWHNAYFRNEAGNIVGTLSSGEDITARKQAEDRIRKLSQAVEQSPESIVITNVDAEIEYVNESFVRNTGYSREEVIGQNPRILHSGKTPKGTYDELWQNMADGKVWQGEFHNKRKDGSEYTEHAIVSPIRQPDGRISHYVAVKEDITQKKLAEAEIHRLAFYDTLTGLPNRSLLLERMEQMLSMSRRGNHHSALVTLNIDRFKTINDAGGQPLGDALLKAMGERIGGLLREGDVLARISGDEFAILLPDFAAEQHSAAHQSMHVAEKIMGSMRQPFELGGSEHTVSVCLGAALFPENEEDAPLDILRRSNTALHFAKSKGTGQLAFFESDLDEIAKQRFDIERELRHGIESGELRLYLQPQVDAAGNIVGAEALLRWQHPQRGLLPPMAFIPIAEESDLIVDIGEWVFAEVCRLLVTNDVKRPMRFAVNISPRHFRQPDFVDWIKQGLAESGADPTLLTLEITEGMVINNIVDVIAKMNELSMLGIHFSMDDFGTGYSSLSYLKRLPINELKIDKTFVQDLTTDMEDAALVETILAVAKLMHLSVVAEGVETKEQAAFLNERATVIHQGYLFGRPEPAEDLFKRISGQ
ncbi:MAG: EAL domain-containing protein, partial [Pseudomonadota bacterium]